MARVLRAACCVLRALHAFPTGKVVRGPTRTVVGMACMLACCVLRAGACCPPREGGWVPLRAFPVPCCCRTGMVAGLTTGMVDVAQMKRPRDVDRTGCPDRGRDGARDGAREGFQCGHACSVTWCCPTWMVAGFVAPARAWLASLPGWWPWCTLNEHQTGVRTDVAASVMSIGRVARIEAGMAHGDASAGIRAQSLGVAT